MHFKKGSKRATQYGREYEILGGPYETNDGRGKVYVIRDKDDGLVRLMAARHLETLDEGD